MTVGKLTVPSNTAKRVLPLTLWWIGKWPPIHNRKMPPPHKTPKTWLDNGLPHGTYPLPNGYQRSLPKCII